MILPDDRLATMDPTDPCSQRVAESLPPALPAPAPMRRVRFLRGLLLFWIAPRRYGPHLASDFCKRALLAHLISLAAVLAIVGYTAAAVELSRWPDWFDLRVLAARVVVETLARSAAGGAGWLVALGAVAALPLLELGMVVLATLLMPWCAGGDAAGSVFRRSLNNVWWSTTGFVPLAVAGMVVVVKDDAITAWLRARGDPLLGLIPLGTLAVLIVIVSRMLLTGAARYVGPADGPGFRRRDVRCRTCGYRLIGLAVASACPECGRQISESLPGVPREDAPPVGILRMLKLQWRILRYTRVLGEVAAGGRIEEARRLWCSVYTCLVVSFVILVRILAGPMTVTEVAQVVVPMLLLVTLVPLGIQSIVTACGCLWGLSRLGIQDLRVSATVGFYAAPLAWPIALLLMAMATLQREWVRQWVAVTLRVQRWWPALSGDLLLAIMLGMLAAGFVLVWWLRLCRGLMDVRHVNT